ncbi:MAG: hypothetical protein JXA14_15805 [Anaerolineae bacterium]|nr:hypothetical protein [Anaerolineae bacterium]
MYINPWANWWTLKALREGLDFYEMDYLFYPRGVHLHFHSFSHVNTFLWMPLAPLLGDIAAYNLTVLISYPLAAFTMYLLAKDLDLSGPAAFLAGLVYGFSPYHLAKADNPVLCSTQWIPLFVLFFLRGIRKKDLRSSVLAAIFMVLTALTSWHLMTLTSMWVGLYLLYSVVFERNMWNRRALYALLLTVALSGLILAPFLYPLVHEVLTMDEPYVARPDMAGNDLLAFFVPGPDNPLMSAFLRPIHSNLRMLPGTGRTPPVYVGITIYLLALLAAIKRWRRSFFWLMAATVFAFFSLNSPLTINGIRLEWLRLPRPGLIMGIISYPFRFNDLFAFNLAILGAIGWDVLHRQLRARALRIPPLWVTGALAALLLFAYAKIPFPAVGAQVPSFYYRLAEEEGDFGIVDVPMGRARDKRYMFFQMYHGKKLVGGTISRPPRDAGDFMDTVPILGAIDHGGKPPDRAAFGVREQLEELAAYDIRYLILHADQLSDERLALWKAYLAVPPVYEDPVVYDTAFDFTPRWRTSDDLMILDAEWVSGDISQAGWGELSVTWLADRPPERNLSVRVSFVDSEGWVAQRELFRIGDEGWPTSKWPVGAAAAYAYPVQIGPFVRPDEYALVLELVDSASGQTHGEAVIIGSIEVAALPREFVPPAAMHALSVDFGDDLTLLGYDVEQSDEMLRLTLHWLARRRMDVFYKFFVHLYDVDSGALVAQTDAVPRDWTYPTTWWKADEVVSDETILSLSDVPSGRYHVAVGVYDAESGERLTVIDAAGEGLAEGRLMLPEEIAR